MFDALNRGLAYLDEEALRGDEEPSDMTKIVELSQSLRMNLALSYFKVTWINFFHRYKTITNTQMRLKFLKNRSTNDQL
jgi:hypothetical protein